MKNPSARMQAVPAMALVLGVMSVNVHAQDARPFGYLQDQGKQVVKTGSSLCVRTGYWTPSLATLECDPDLFPKVAQAPAPKPLPLPAPVAEPPAPSSPPPPRPVPAPRPAPFIEKLTLSADALFNFDKSEVTQDGKVRLDGLIGKIKGAEIETIIAIGHADRIGSDAYNLKLSIRRAQAVKAYLIAQGIDGNRIHIEGKGEKQPVTAPGDCKGQKGPGLIACLQPDRRVVIEVIGTRVR